MRPSRVARPNPGLFFGRFEPRLEGPAEHGARVLDEECAYLARQGWREPARCIELWLPVLSIL